jgi:nucleotide-binding universal stress UspA family protein
MKPINKIIVAVDFSEDSIEAAHYAAKLANDVSATILLTNVFNQRDIDMMNIVATRVGEFTVKRYVKENIKERKEGLESIAEKINTYNLEIETSVRIEVPYEGLLQDIEDKKPDLLVMGTKGRSNIVDAIIGSCAQKMFRRSPIPLLSIRRKASKE